MHYTRIKKQRKTNDRTKIKQNEINKGKKGGRGISKNTSKGLSKGKHEQKEETIGMGGRGDEQKLNEKISLRAKGGRYKTVSDGMPVRAARHMFTINTNNT